MTTETLTGTPTRRCASASPVMPAERIVGLRCRNCGRSPRRSGRTTSAPPASARSRSPTTCELIGGLLDRATIARSPTRASGATSSSCPSSAPPARGLAGRLDPADRRRPARRRRSASTGCWLKDDTRNPTLSFKDRAVAIAARGPSSSALETLACASTGNLAGATAAAAAAIGLPAFVFVPADLEPAKIDHALAYGATVVPIDGTYDDVNRLSMEVADELGWGFVNVNLRPFYAEGSKTLAFEIAEAARLAACRTSSSRRSPRARCSPSWPRASTSSSRSG